MESLPGISASDRPNVGRQDAGATGGRGRDNEEERRRGSLRDIIELLRIPPVKERAHAQVSFSQV